MDALGEVRQRAREAYSRRDWPDALHGLEAVQEQATLSADEWDMLADVSWWMGLIDESVAAGAQAYRCHLDEGRPRPAGMAAMGVALNVLLRGDEPTGLEWIGRCQRLLVDEPEGVEHGYLLFLTNVLGPFDSLRLADEDAVEALVVNAHAVRDLGRAHGEPTLVALGTLAEGRVLTRIGRAVEGSGLLDEVMMALRADELRPEWTGELYCQLLAAANEVVDLERLRHLLGLTTRWLEQLPAAVLYTGLCGVHRAQLQQFTGDWTSAESDAARASKELVGITPLGAAEAYYRVGEIRRLRGDVAGAEQAYHLAHRCGRDPQPGLALLRLAEGKVRVALASIDTALVGEADRLVRALLRSAQVEIAVAAGDHDLAAVACGELEGIASVYRTGGLEAMSCHARGWCLLAAGRSREALPVLRDACRRWQDLDVPYEGARVRVLLARTYRALGNTDTAALEFAAAAAEFDRLGATTDLRVIDAASRQRVGPGGLTVREAEVLAHVAQGGSNANVAAALFISERTVARHLSNIFAKLGVSSRTAAAAWAVEHGLVPRSRE